MATSGIFQLITNDGKQDRMLMATALLNKRLLTIERARSRDPNIKDPTPTLVDIERTHILNEWDEQSYEKDTASGPGILLTQPRSATPTKAGNSLELLVPPGYSDVFSTDCESNSAW